MPTVITLGTTAYNYHSSSSKSSLITPATDILPFVSDYADFLKKGYAQFHASLPDKLPLTLGKEYIRLSVVKNKIDSQKDADDFISKKSKGNIEEILAKNEEIQMEDIFVLGDGVRLVVVQGEPGIGKSTLSLELCHQWQNETMLHQFSLVLLLKLREESVRSANDISDLFFPFEEDITNAVVKHVRTTLGKGVLFIFDGYDEFPTELRKKSFIMTMIKDPRYLSEAKIMVTTRPSALAELQPLLKSLKKYKHIEILGFTRDAMYRAAYNALDDPSLFTKFTKYLSTNPVVELIMHNPLNCAIVVNMYKRTFQTHKPIPHTQTELYTELSRCLLSSYLSGIDDPLANNLQDRLENLPPHLYQQVFIISELAYNGVVTEKVIFDKIPKNGTGVGLLIKHHVLFDVNATVQYSFFHDSLQEYLSAFYLYQKGVEEQRIFITKHLTSPDVFNVVKFVAGLTKMLEVGWDMFFSSYALLPTSCLGAEKCLKINPLVMKCFYEAQTVKNCALFNQNLEIVEFKGILTLYDMYALGYTMGLCGKSWNLFLPHTNALQLEMLTHGLVYNNQSNVSIHVLSLSSAYGVMTQNDTLLQIPDVILSKLEVLILEDCDIDKEGFHNLALCIPYLRNLRVLIIQDNPGGPGCLVELLRSLEYHKNLEYLSMYKLDLGLPDVTALSSLLMTSNSLRWIMVGEWPNSTCEFDKALAKAVLSSSTLTSADINFMSSSYESLCILESLQHINSSLSSLTFRDISLTYERNMSSIPQNLYHFIRANNQLQKMRLYFHLKSEEVNNILLSLHENHFLEMIQLLYEVKELMTSSNYDSRIDFALDPFENLYTGILKFTLPRV